MPNEVITRCLDAQLTVQWGKATGPDPAVILSSWRETQLPDGAHADWAPVAAWDLDRPSINKLIRTLRQARDQAFGRDE